MQPLQGGFVHGGIGKVVNTPAIALGGIQGGVGQGEQHLKCFSVGREHGHARRNGNTDRQATDHRGLTHYFHQVPRLVGSLRGALHIGYQHQEFIAAEPPHDGMDTGRTGQAQAHFAQQLVARHMAQRVVEHLEVVDIHHHQRRLLAGQPAMSQGHGGPQRGMGAIGQSGHHVLGGQVGDLLFRRLAGTQVGKRCNVMGNFAVRAMAQHRQVQPLGIHLTILATAPDLTGPAAMRRQGLQHGGRKRAVWRAQRQGARVAPQHLIGAVAGDLGKSGVHQHDAVLRIGDHHAIVALVQHPSRQFQLGGGHPLVGDVAAQHQHMQALPLPSEGGDPHHIEHPRAAT